jgi:hypothetical protein
VDEGIYRNQAGMGQKHSAITWPSFRLPVVGLILKLYTLIECICGTRRYGDVSIQ